jgi:hypothetical protein
MVAAPSIIVQVVAPQGSVSPEVAAAERAFDMALGEEGRVRGVPRPPSEDDEAKVRAELSAARKNLLRARQLGMSLEVEQARDLVQQALETLCRRLPVLDAAQTTLRDAWVVRANIEAMDEQFAAAERAVRRAITFDPLLLQDKKRFVPQLSRKLAEVKRSIERAKPSTLVLTGALDGATVWIDGVVSDVRPGASTLVPPGTVQINVRKPGARWYFQEVEVCDGCQKSHEVVLEPAPLTPLVASVQVEALLAGGREVWVSAPSLSGLSATHALAVAVQPRDASVQLAAALVELPSGRLVARDARTVLPQELAATARFMTHQLVTQLLEPPPLRTVAPVAVAAHDRKPVDGRRRLWIALGAAGGVVLVGAAVGIGLGVDAWVRQSGGFDSTSWVLFGRP